MRERESFFSDGKLGHGNAIAMDFCLWLIHCSQPPELPESTFCHLKFSFFFFFLLGIINQKKSR